MFDNISTGIVIIRLKQLQIYACYKRNKTLLKKTNKQDAQNAFDVNRV